MSSTFVRVALVLVGIVLLGAGWLAWIQEEKIGSGTNFLVAVTQGNRMDGSAIVYDVDEEAGTRTKVFEGSPEEAQEYTAARGAEGKSFVTPGRLFALGGVLLFAVLYGRKLSVSKGA
jgi:hypothetical protein